ncbi:MAG TPA: M23 family metallopeptidase, partial [Candidatus Magasanikbacteria bacterium]|nr:M23 family metallopeptidase [Candidatus Magasanikbacteria bacterium]
MIRRITLFFGIIFFYNTFFIQNINAISLDLKIPFPKNESWLVTQGYDGDGWGSGKPTHNSSSKDRFALDFSLPGESDYNKQVLAVANGIVSIKESKVIDKITGDIKYTGYGKYIDIDHGNGIISRYAHLLSFSVEDGEMVKQGQLIGYLDSTGYSSGSHLHFAMYQKDAKGNLQP